MDYRTLKNSFKVMAFVGMALSVLYTLPLGVGLFDRESIEGFVAFDVGLFLTSLTVYMALHRHSIQMRIPGAILTVNLIWVLLGVSGAIPFMLETHVGFVDGLFESISGFTTTGATIYDNIEALPRSILMLRSLMHWIGGLGIIVLGVGLFSLINPTGSMALFRAESTGNRLEKLSERIRDTALKIWGVYLGLTLLDMLALWGEGMSLFDAINHAFSTLSTGGFSTKNASMGFWEDRPVILWTTTLFMMLAGINFLAHLRLLRGSIKGYRAEEVRWYLIAWIGLSSALAFDRIGTSHDAPMHIITHAFFTIASIITTTGFGSINYESWGQGSVVILFLAMLLGGNTGSTAGGFKVTRYVVLMKNIPLQIRRLLHPKAISELYVDGERITYDTLAVISGFALVFTLSNVLLSFYLFARGYDLLTSLSAAIAMIGNIGPGFGRVGVVENYAFFSVIDKLVLSAAMILGRLEFFTVLLIFSRTFWKRF